MSIRDRTEISLSEEPMSHWSEDTYGSVHDNQSISSEDEEDGEPEGDQVHRSRPVQEIWDAVTVWSSLQMLPEAEEILEILRHEPIQLEDLLKYPLNSYRAPLLLSIWINNKEAVHFLLDHGADSRTKDNFGRTALHLAAYQGHNECIQLLLAAGAITNIRTWDASGVATPLHCAASRGSVSCVKTLLNSGADVNAGLSGPARSPLHHAVSSGATDCVRELLEAGACPNTPQVFTETPLHVAAALGYIECIRILLKYGADVRVQFGVDKPTALHLVAEDGNAESVKLLLEAGASPNATNKKLQTPLHLASLAQSIETLEILLKHGANPNASDKDGRTPLHSAIVKVSRSCECVRLLLNAGANVNQADIFGYTPLHIAALNEFSQCVFLLINYGGDVTARTNGGISVLNFIIRRTPDVMPKYIAKLDYAIKLNDHEIGDVDCELKLDFRILVPCVGRGETDLLLNFIQVGQREILKHPLCETFLFLKWRRIRKFFLLSLFYHTVFVIFFSIYVLGVYLKDCPPQKPPEPILLDSLMGFEIPSTPPPNPCEVSVSITVLGYVLLIFSTLFLMKEIFQIVHNWKGYVRQWDNWLQWLILLSVLLCVVSGTKIELDVKTWQHHIAAIGIFLTWLELMMIVGRFPMFGLYVQMFTTVAVNFSKFLLAYSCLLIAFGLSFGVLFANYKSFTNLFVGLIKTVIMMSGELEFEDIFYSDDEAEKINYPGTAHVMFLAFVILVTVILTNLLVGLAVSDIQGLQQSAGLDRLVRQAELIAHLESMLFSELLHYDNCILKRILAFSHRSALLLTSHYHWALYIRPNDPREAKIPKDLIQNIYKLVAGRKERSKSKYKKYAKTSSQKTNCRSISAQTINRSDSVQMLSRMNSYNCEDLSNIKQQVAELSNELKQYSEAIQNKLTQLSSVINSVTNK